MNIDAHAPTVGGRRTIAWIHCNYHADRADTCLSLADAFLARLGCLDDSVRVCVENGPCALVKPGRHTAWTQMSGSNRAREFSAWQEGWAHLRASGVSPDIVVLTNDTFPFHQPYRLLAPLLRISLQKLLESGRRRWALGVVERGFAYQHLSQYLTSFFVVLEKEAASLVMDSLTEPVSDWQVAPDAASGKIIHSRDKQYEESINRWLLAPASRSWYGAAPLTGTNYTAMAGKARSIVLEHGLSRRLQDGDAHLVSCFDLPFGFLARWYCRIDERRRTNKWFAKTHVA